MNRITHFLRLIAGFILTLTLTTCALEDPEPPLGGTNRIDPVMQHSAVIAITHDSVQVTAGLDSVGNTAALKFGWVWSEHTEPTGQDSLKEIVGVPVSTAAFETGISGLTLGKIYYFRPFITTAWGTFYGEEVSVYMGIPQFNQPDYINLACGDYDLYFPFQCPVRPDSFGLLYSLDNSLPTLEKHDSLVLTRIDSISSTSYILTSNLTYLLEGSYTFRAFAVTPSGVGYSPPVILQNTDIPVTQFAINTDTVIFQGASVKFINNSIGATAYQWDFGDGQFSVEESPIHTYKDTGTIQAKLTANSVTCPYLPKTMSIRVIPNPFDNYWADIPGGSFQMGCTPGDTSCMDNEKPVHAVTLSDFTLGKTEITQRQYELVTGTNLTTYICPDCPADVSWDQIIYNFLPKLFRKTGQVHRLPTEAEWEYAARGGQGFIYAGSNNPNEVAQYDSPGSTKPVAQKQPNGYGLYDMSGNAWEWCSDWYDAPYPSTAQIDPKGPAVDVSGLGHVVRGGNNESPAILTRVSSRSVWAANPDPFWALYWGYGFRVAREK